MRAWAWVPWQHSAVRPRSLPRWGLGEAAAQRSHATAAGPVARAVGVRLRTPAHRALLGTPRRRTGPTMMARTTTGAHLLASGQCGSYGAIGTCGHAASLAALVRRLSTRGHAAALGKQCGVLRHQCRSSGYSRCGPARTLLHRGAAQRRSSHAAEPELSLGGWERPPLLRRWWLVGVVIGDSRV